MEYDYYLVSTTVLCVTMPLPPVIDHPCEVKNLYSAQGEWSYHVEFMVRHPKRQLHTALLIVLSIAVSGSGYTGN